MQFLREEMGLSLKDEARMNLPISLSAEEVAYPSLFRHFAL